MKSFIIKIHGMVQAVSFRYSAMEKARELNLSGFVKNEPDGSVYVEIEGKEKDINNFLKWCHKGPRFSKVEKVECNDREPVGNYYDFKVL